ncbi:MAG: F0F1 ATP synthase subunit epsilon [Bifidobacteriaceae bacterium]|nr:F0F1 ATP synthase subunit epsilon [Bifidobacteriaceae bacterium]MBQ5779861.1 F0F1 ATP synthase subunit epsilon [Aeriscardovia sp.]
MAAKTFDLTVASREKPLWQGKASQVQVPALGGGLTFLPGHASSFVLLSKGDLKINGEKDLAFSIEGGFASFEKNQMVIAVDSGEEEELKPKKA